MLSCYNTAILINVIQEPETKPPRFLLNAQLSSSVHKVLQVVSSPARRRRRRRRLPLWTLGVFTLGLNIRVSIQD